MDFGNCRVVAVVGSRRRLDREAVAEVVRGLPAHCVIVSGGCAGPDVFAAEAARAQGREVIELRPDLAGVRSRGEAVARYHARNRRIVETADALIAFVAPDRKGGTEHTIRCARAKGVPVVVL